MRNQTAVFLAFLTLTLLLAGCASGPAPPAKGTPAFYWQAANETFTTGDYMKTSDHLEALAKGENEFTARAYPWRLVLSAGLAKGYLELADAFENGGRANKTNPTPFRRQMSDYRSMASRFSLQFAETLEAYEKTKPEGEIPLDFPMPRGSAAMVAALGKAGSGILVVSPELDTAQKQALERAVLLAVCKAAGAAGDTAKAREMFKTPPVKTKREVFFTALAENLLDLSKLFTPMKLDQPDRLEFFLKHATEALQGVPDSKDLKELKSKIQAEQKKVKKRS